MRIIEVTEESGPDGFYSMVHLALWLFYVLQLKEPQRESCSGLHRVSPFSSWKGKTGFPANPPQQSCSFPAAPAAGPPQVTPFLTADFTGRPGPQTEKKILSGFNQVKLRAGQAPLSGQQPPLLLPGHSWPVKGTGVPAWPAERGPSGFFSPPAGDSEDTHGKGRIPPALKQKDSGSTLRLPSRSE